MSEIKKWNEFQNWCLDVFGSPDEAKRRMMEGGGPMLELDLNKLSPSAKKLIEKLAPIEGVSFKDFAKKFLIQSANKECGIPLTGAERFKNLCDLDSRTPLRIKRALATESEISNNATQTCSVYFMRQLGNGLTKIGISKKPKFREATLCSQEPVMLISKMEFSTRKAAKKAESDLHKHFKKYHMRGEWFKLPEEVAKLGVEAVYKSIS